jgi:hypothetical protein
MEEKKNLSPEEKLLNVIQGKENGEKAAAAKGVLKPQAQTVLTPPPAAVRPTGDSPKSASTAQAASPVRPALAPVPVPAHTPAHTVAYGSPDATLPTQSASAVEGGAPKAVPSSEQAKERANLKVQSANRLDVRSRTLATVNRLLRVVVVAMFGLCVWEIWAKCSTDAMPVNSAVGGNTGTATAPAATYNPSSEILASFVGKSLFTPVEETPEPPVTNIVKTTISEVQQYVTRNLNLIGVAPGKDGTIQEAILTDTQTKRNYFLKVGDKITMKTWAIELKQIAADRAVFQCGKEEIQVQ